MAKKAAPKKSPAPKVPAAAPVSAVPVEQPIAETAVRKTVAPKATPIAKKATVPVSYDRIAERAYYISRSHNGGSEYENWLRAEAELKGESI